MSTITPDDNSDIAGLEAQVRYLLPVALLDGLVDLAGPVATARTPADRDISAYRVRAAIKDELDKNPAALIAAFGLAVTVMARNGWTTENLSQGNDHE